MTKRRPWWSDLPGQTGASLGALLLSLSLLSAPAWAAPTKKTALKKAPLAASVGKKPVLPRARPKAPPPQEPLAKNPAGYLVASIGAAEILERETVGLHGSASFYGYGFQGRKTASGELFDVREFTGASNRFPLGSKVAVYRPDSEACVIVRINDRMAGHRRRVIDLSRGAAEALGMLHAGMAMVRVARLAPTHAEAVFADESEVDAETACRHAFGLPPAFKIYGRPLNLPEFLPSDETLGGDTQP